MSIVRKFLAAAALAVAAIGFSAPAATAQGTKIVVIDSNQILANSRAGQDIEAKLRGIEDAMNRELKPTADSIQSELTSLRSRAANRSQEEIVADTQLMADIEAVTGRQREFQQRRQTASRELQLTEREAFNQFRTALSPVLEEVVNEYNADLMVDRSDVVFAQPTLNVTQAVITKLDARTPTISVVRQTLPTQPAGQ